MSRRWRGRDSRSPRSIFARSRRYRTGIAEKLVSRLYSERVPVQLDRVLPAGEILCEKSFPAPLETRPIVLSPRAARPIRGVCRLPQPGLLPPAWHPNVDERCVLAQRFAPHGKPWSCSRRASRTQKLPPNNKEIGSEPFQGRRR
jgi:hypothetical protein